MHTCPSRLSVGRPWRCAARLAPDRDTPTPALTRRGEFGESPLVDPHIVTWPDKGSDCVLIASNLFFDRARSEPADQSSAPPEIASPIELPIGHDEAHESALKSIACKDPCARHASFKMRPAHVAPSAASTLWATDLEIVIGGTPRYDERMTCLPNGRTLHRTLHRTMHRRCIVQRSTAPGARQALRRARGGCCCIRRLSDPHGG